jgi:hypothetical protein
MPGKKSRRTFYRAVRREAAFAAPSAFISRLRVKARRPFAQYGEGDARCPE